jgi:alpha-N-arabinofuranosidase
MTPQTYMDAYRGFATAMPRFTASVFETPKRYLIAAGPDGNKPLERVAWTRDFMRALTSYRQPPIAGYDLHFYDWNMDTEDDTPVQFDQAGWDRVINGCLELEEVIEEQWALLQEGLALLPEPESTMDRRLERIDLVVGEWGNWHRDAFFARPALYQQVTMRDAITTALTLDLLQRSCDKVTVACNAQTINVLNSLILTEGEHTILTPNFDVFMMYKPHRGATALRVAREDEASGVHTFASVADDEVLVNLTNIAMSEAADVELDFAVPVRLEQMETLASPDPTAHNTEDAPDAVRRTAKTLDGAVGRSHRVQLVPGSVNVVRARIVATN